MVASTVGKEWGPGDEVSQVDKVALAESVALDLAGEFRPGFIGGGMFLRYLTFYRILYCEGRLGGGKTLLATACAHYLLARGLVDRVWSNYPLKYGVRAAGEPVNVAMVLDESWAFAGRMRDAISYAAHLRHRNSYLFLPSVFPPHHLLRRFRVRRELNLALLGINLWIYRWQIKEYDVHGFFGLRFRRYFDQYDTSYEPASDWGISKILKQSVKAKLDNLPEQDFVEFTEGVDKFDEAVKRQKK